MSGILSGILADLCSDILSSSLYGILFDIYSDILPSSLSGILSGIYSDILQVLSSLSGILLQRGSRGGGEGGGVAPLLKSRDPHLAGGELHISRIFVSP